MMIMKKVGLIFAFIICFTLSSYASIGGLCKAFAKNFTKECQTNPQIGITSCEFEKPNTLVFNVRYDSDLAKEILNQPEGARRNDFAKEFFAVVFGADPKAEEFLSKLKYDGGSLKIRVPVSNSGTYWEDTELAEFVLQRIQINRKVYSR